MEAGVKERVIAIIRGETMIALSRVLAIEMRDKRLNSGYNLKESPVYILHRLENISK